MQNKSVRIGNKHIQIKEYDNGAVSIEGNIGENNQRKAFSYTKEEGLEKVKIHLENIHEQSVSELEGAYEEALEFVSELG